jgi:hypothetical protein
MNTKYIDPSAAIHEFRRFTGFKGKLDKDDLLAFTNDALDRILPGEELIQQIVILPVTNYKCELPDNFKFVTQAAYRLDCENKSNPRVEISQLTQKILGSDCDLEINLNCPKCGIDDICDCKTAIVTVDVDRIFESHNPAYHYQYANHFYRYGTMNDSFGPTSQYHSEFRLMRRTSSNFFNVPYHISECPNLNLDCNIEYSIDSGNMIVNFKEGEVLLSYLGDRMNEDGFRMLPNNPTVIRAISYCLAERYLYQQYLETLEQNKRVAWQMHVELTEKWITRARNELKTPEFDDMFDFVTGFIKRVVPKYDYWEDLGRRRKDSFMYPGETYNQRGYRL